MTFYIFSSEKWLIKSFAQLLIGRFCFYIIDWYMLFIYADGLRCILYGTYFSHLTFLDSFFLFFLCPFSFLQKSSTKCHMSQVELKLDMYFENWTVKAPASISGVLGLDYQAWFLCCYGSNWTLCVVEWQALYHLSHISSLCI